MAPGGALGACGGPAALGPLAGEARSTQSTTGGPAIVISALTDGSEPPRWAGPNGTQSGCAQCVCVCVCECWVWLCVREWLMSVGVRTSLCMHVYVHTRMPPCRNMGWGVCAHVCPCMGMKVSHPQMASGVCNDTTPALAQGTHGEQPPCVVPLKGELLMEQPLLTRRTLMFLVHRFPNTSGPFSALRCPTKNVTRPRHSGGRWKHP